MLLKTINLGYKKINDLIYKKNLYIKNITTYNILDFI